MDDLFMEIKFLRGKSQRNIQVKNMESKIEEYA
eukprot:CAMPEP_0170563738 /NCGR_PEP_ID=MMETSP0211-20121228/68641_1 /TAXON_ID=311385 /ORGANISM="Pseudokeronopsis sp., Strain OXSARD2" /LENGTH=32 /DNA_ID= /DNA_START= /DNA_END= /DNA_ORIENTATION=